MASTPAQIGGRGSPPSATSSTSDQTYMITASPARNRKRDNESLKPKVISALGRPPACLVQATATYVGSNQIYVFGGFDQETDEVYNHVLRLNLDTRQWSLVDNYGDIPGVRMGHTATLWLGKKIIIFGGENEHRTYLNDLIIFDLETAHWHQPEIRGTPPRGRARHSAVIHGDRLFIIGGLSGENNNTILDEFCYLDLSTWEWSRTWRFLPRYDHTTWVWAGRIWLFGGIGGSFERTNEIWWIDPNRTPAFEIVGSGISSDPIFNMPSSARARTLTTQNIATGANYVANSSAQANVSQSSARMAPLVPGSVSSLTFVSGANVPRQNVGTHFHAFSSGCLVDFVLPGVTASLETSLCTLELESMRWDKLAEGKDLFPPAYKWHYCALNAEGTHAWLLGCRDNGGNIQDANEYLSDVLPIDLRKLGLLGNTNATDFRFEQPQMPTSDSQLMSSMSGVGADLARLFDKSPQSGSGADFVITAEPDLLHGGDMRDMESQSPQEHGVSQPIHVHRLIMEARWPHFARAIAARMVEFHTKKLHIPEPYSAVRAFCNYLYTDSITPAEDNSPTLDVVAGMLIMANTYDMPRLRSLCRHRLGRELDVEHAASVWEKAGIAGEDWLRKRAARYCMTYWGRVVRTTGFMYLRQASVVELCQEADEESRVLNADELEFVGALGGARLGPQATEMKMRMMLNPGEGSATGEEADDAEDDSMDL